MNRIEEDLKELVFRDISFVLNDKTIKKGKLQIFNTKQNFIKFRFDDATEKEWELSYPYGIKKIDNGFIFDYSLSAFCPRTEEVYWVMKAMNKKDKSKFFDNYLYVLTS